MIILGWRFDFESLKSDYRGGVRMIEHFSVPRSLGEKHLEYKKAKIVAEGLTIVKVIPNQPIFGGEDIGWDIQAENGVEPFRSVITGELVNEM